MHSSLLCFAMLALDSVLRRHNGKLSPKRVLQGRGHPLPVAVSNAPLAPAARGGLQCTRHRAGLIPTPEGSPPLQRVHSPPSASCPGPDGFPVSLGPQLADSRWVSATSKRAVFQRVPPAPRPASWRPALFAPIPLPCKPGAFLERLPACRWPVSCLPVPPWDTAVNLSTGLGPGAVRTATLSGGMNLRQSGGCWTPFLICSFLKHSASVSEVLAAPGICSSCILRVLRSLYGLFPCWLKHPFY